MSYYAIVGKVDRVEPIPGANKIQVAWVLGTQVIVSLDTKIGDLGLLFPEGGKISPWFLKRNSLYRDSTKNEKPEKTGFFEDQGRVRAQPFLKVKSEGFFCSLEYLGPIGDGTQVPPLTEGTQLTHWNNEVLCEKYVNRAAVGGPVGGSKKSRFRIEVPTFREHVDTDQWRFNNRAVDDPAARVTITAKYHGTSGRWGLHRVKYDPIERWLVEHEPFGSSFKRAVWNTALRLYRRVRWWDGTERLVYVVGSRRVIIWKPEKESFHGSEKFRFEILEGLKAFLTEGMTIYGEIVGFVNGKLIMPAHDLNVLKDKSVGRAFGTSTMEYRYGVPEGHHKLIIYRITTLDGTSAVQEWLPSEVRKFCVDNGLSYPYTMYEEERSPAGFANWDEAVAYWTQKVATPGSPDTLNEGVVIRIDYDNQKPTRFLKEKTWWFKVCEGISKEKDGDPEDDC